MRLSGLHCNVARSIVFYFILITVFQEASTYLSDIFTKSGIECSDKPCKSDKQTNKKTISATDKELLGTCIKPKKKSIYALCSNQ